MGLPPHNNISAIICRWEDKNGIGSGFLISSNLVLTCAHIFFRKEIFVNKRMIRVFPGEYDELGEGYEVD